MSTANPSQNRSFHLPRISFASVGSNGMLIIYAIIVLLPLFIVVTNTMRPTREIYRVPVALPASINFDSYVIAWNEADFSTYFMNSLVITLSSVVLGTSVSALAAYILGRYNFPGGRILSSFFVAGLTLPFRLAIVPLFLLLNSLGDPQPRSLLILDECHQVAPASGSLYPADTRTTRAIRELAARFELSHEIAQVVILHQQLSGREPPGDRFATPNVYSRPASTGRACRGAARRATGRPVVDYSDVRSHSA